MARKITPQQFQQEWVRQAPAKYRKYAPLMAQIAQRESGLQEGTDNSRTGPGGGKLNQNGTVDHGPLAVNDVWRSDPVVGPLFKDGSVKTLQGAVTAGIRILEKQGPKAWATYNGATDKKYLGGFSGAKGGTSAAPPTLGTTTAAKPAGLDVDSAIVDSMLSSRKGSLFDRVMGRIDSGQYTTAATPATKIAPPTSGAAVGDTSLPQQAGNFKVSPTANRKGRGLQSYVTEFASQMASLGGFTIGTGTNHNQMTVNGNVSDHWDGSAMDLPATGKQGDQIAYQAFRTAGVPEKKARLWARNGGLYNIQTPRGRVQVIWKTNEGGNHFNHVHVGIRPGK